MSQLCVHIWHRIVNATHTLNCLQCKKIVNENRIIKFTFTQFTRETKVFFFFFFLIFWHFRWTLVATYTFLSLPISPSQANKYAFAPKNKHQSTSNWITNYFFARNKIFAADFLCDKHTRTNIEKKKLKKKWKLCWALESNCGVNEKHAAAVSSSLSKWISVYLLLAWWRHMSFTPTAIPFHISIRFHCSRTRFRVKGHLFWRRAWSDPTNIHYVDKVVSTKSLISILFHIENAKHPQTYEHRNVSLNQPTSCLTLQYISEFGCGI